MKKKVLLIIAIVIGLAILGDFISKIILKIMLTLLFFISIIFLS